VPKKVVSNTVEQVTRTAYRHCDNPRRKTKKRSTDLLRRLQIQRKMAKKTKPRKCDRGMAKKDNWLLSSTCGCLCCAFSCFWRICSSGFLWGANRLQHKNHIAWANVRKTRNREKAHLQAVWCIHITFAKHVRITFFKLERPLFRKQRRPLPV